MCDFEGAFRYFLQINKYHSQYLIYKCWFLSVVLSVPVCLCVFMCVCMCVWVCAYVNVCVCVCVYLQ